MLFLLLFCLLLVLLLNPERLGRLVLVAVLPVPLTARILLRERLLRRLSLRHRMLWPVERCRRS
jgi:hypothetical protein